MTLARSDLQFVYGDVFVLFFSIHSVWLNAYWSVKVIVVLSIKLISILWELRSF